MYEIYLCTVVQINCAFLLLLIYHMCERILGRALSLIKLVTLSFSCAPDSLCTETMTTEQFLAMSKLTMTLASLE